MYRLIALSLALTVALSLAAGCAAPPPPALVAPGGPGGMAAAGRGATPPAATQTVVPSATATFTRTPEPTPLPPTATATPTAAPLGAQWKASKPNELGRVMILEYHKLGPEEDRWTRSYANFWNDLEMLYAKGYRPIGLHDLIDNKITTPAGYSPIVLTFDDSSPMQFNFVSGPGGEPMVDPQSAVGMLERFHQLHPDFPLKATFFVLPGADPPHDLFGQKELKERKIRYLVERGFELGNHTFHHHRLDILKTKAEVAAQLGGSVEAIAKIVPGYKLRTLALPLGMFPADESWAYEGAKDGFAYRNELILLATGGGTVPPNHREWDPYQVPRIQATAFELDFRQAYIGFYDNNPDKRYVSDGDPDLLVFPTGVASNYRADGAHKEVSLPADVATQFHAVRLR